MSPSQCQSSVAVQRFFYELSTPRNITCTISELIETFGWENSILSLQHDSHEFFTQFCDFLQEYLTLSSHAKHL